jgi:hypothetical protein
VRGYVDDLPSLFATCRLSVAPLRYGGGIKGKIVTSLSLGVPVVATSIAAEGMDLRHDDSVLVADDPGAMADQIMRLYAEDDLWARLAANGYRVFQDNFSLEAGQGAVLTLLDGLVAARRDAIAVSHNHLIAEREDLIRARDAAVSGRDDASARLDAAVSGRDAALAQRDALLVSRSWRVTAPLRRLRTLLVRR